jgi:energy-coupling factor transporter ATP-binding protein EcfA2
MLFLITGASGSGKTACLPALRALMPHVALHDFDERGVPLHADKAWRHRQAEAWIGVALGYQAAGQDMVLSGQVVPGEVLACPSAPRLAGLAACLLDCHDVRRVDRLRARPGGAEWATQDMLCWAAWQRMHAVDPRWRPDVIRDGAWPEMRWERWADWARGDPRWQTWVLDTTDLRLDEVAARLAAWMAGYERRPG